MIELYEYPLWQIFLVGLGVICASVEVGCWLAKNAGQQSSGNVSTLEGAVLGLLALMIGFTFSMALSRFEARRDAVLNEANAIGTTALRARLLPDPHRTETIKLLREYVKLRLDITQRPVSRVDLAQAIERSNAIQEALWQLAKAAIAKDNGMVPTGLFIQTLNEMIDSQAKRLAALRNRVPNIVILALFGVAAVGGGFAGYAAGFEKRHFRLPVYVTSLVVAAVIMLILDLDRPGSGFIDVSQQPMIDTAAGISAFAD
jgi:hypothetical protein